MGFNAKDVAAFGLSGLPKQLFESKQFAKGNQQIAKAFPNEISKYADMFQNVPILGWIMSGLSATDMASTAYEDTGSVSKAWEAGTAGTFGKSRSPGAYGPGGEREHWDSQDAFQGMIGNQIGGIRNFAGRIVNTKASGKSKNAANVAGNVFGMIDKAIQPNKESNISEEGVTQNSLVGNVTSSLDKYKKMSGLLSSISLLDKFLKMGDEVEEDEEVEQNKEMLKDLLGSRLKQYVFNNMSNKNQLELLNRGGRI